MLAVAFSKTLTQLSACCGDDHGHSVSPLSLVPKGKFVAACY